MNSGERPIGAAKGKQPNTEALCQTPPPPFGSGSHCGKKCSLQQGLLIGAIFAPPPPAAL